MDLYTAIRIRAFRSVQVADKEYLIRSMLRWFSKTFFTPFETVEAMPLEDVMQAFYEEKYASMSEDDLEAEREELLVTDEQKLKRIMDEEASDAEMFEMARAIAEDEAKKKAGKKTADATKGQEMISPLRHPVPGLLKQVREAPQANLPDASTKMPPGISMTFMEEDELQAEIARFEAMADGRGKKS